MQHPHLLEFLGLDSGADPAPAIVSPWKENGNILDFIKKNHEVSKADLVR